MIARPIIALIGLAALLAAPGCATTERRTMPDGSTPEMYTDWGVLWHYVLGMPEKAN